MCIKDVTRVRGYNVKHGNRRHADVSSRPLACLAALVERAGSGGDGWLWWRGPALVERVRAVDARAGTAMAPDGDP